MEKFIKGNIVVLNFPFSDLSGTKRRPALVVSALEGKDIILCQITSVARLDKYAIPISNDDYSNGTLNIKSMIRPNKIFTADESLIQYVACELKEETIKKTIDSIIDILVN